LELNCGGARAAGNEKKIYPLAERLLAGGRGATTVMRLRQRAMRFSFGTFAKKKVHQDLWDVKWPGLG